MSKAVTLVKLGVVLSIEYITECRRELHAVFCFFVFSTGFHVFPIKIPNVFVFLPALVSLYRRFPIDVSPGDI